MMPFKRTRPTGPTTSTGLLSERFALSSAAGVWLLYTALVGVRVTSFGFPRPLMLMERHLLTAGAGIVLDVLLYLVLRRTERATTRRRVALAILLAAPPAVLLSIVNYSVLYVLAPAELFAGTDIDIHPPFIRDIFQTLIENYFVVVAWAVLYIAFSIAVQTGDAMRRVAISEAAARTAELRALRYQLDPHFLFNALNTVSGLVLTGELAKADSTIDALCSFLRTTMTLDATADIGLGDEVALQHLYLRIEQVRFAGRLVVSVDIPASLADAQVPVLLLQPLVENSIRHGVARSLSPVLLSFLAWEAGSLLHVVVEDDGPGEAEGSVQAGHGVGLVNVASRLAVRFDGRAWCNAAARPGGGFRTELVLPLRHGPMDRAST